MNFNFNVVGIFLRFKTLLPHSSTPNCHWPHGWDFAGERARPGCRFRRRAENPFPKLNGSTHGSGATPEPARETGALPSFVQPKLLLARSVFAAGHPAAGVWRSGFREKAAIQFSSRFAALCRDAATSVADFS